ncbi:Ldh family oxidoreductase [Streptomonospora salina]|uniref:LDH2 family malate/lactate/ureidoglycolate dehydrogenase n=1 Tax=Streptomonospora salina TaxID=104205 RepID=A0A841EK71_9ACTN|nr:Ldh family oxidoreductase [Streptomonospora salina]MBB6000740.1 LDH2 family malate/lactate/ureidoglycolate dehydrogenase [Streptomonospora salina]
MTRAVLGGPGRRVSPRAERGSDDPDGAVHRQNALSTDLDQAALGDGDGYAGFVRDTVEALKDLPRAEGTEEILHPGERSADIAEQRGEQGVPVGAKVWADVSAAAERLGAALPPTAAAAAQS